MRAFLCAFQWQKLCMILMIRQIYEEEKTFKWKRKKERKKQCFMRNINWSTNATQVMWHWTKWVREKQLFRDCLPLIHRHISTLDIPVYYTTDSILHVEFSNNKYLESFRRANVMYKKRYAFDCHHRMIVNTGKTKFNFKIVKNLS